ncbi:MAG: O-antigen ligase family protein [candidate division WOR-3 bacterium]
MFPLKTFKYKSLQDLTIYLFILLIGVATICLTTSQLTKITAGTFPLFLIFILYLIENPSSVLVLFFLLTPLIPPVVLHQNSLTPAEILAIPAFALCLLSLLTGNKKAASEILYKNKHIFISMLIFSFFCFLSSIALLNSKNLIPNITSLVLKPIFIALILLVFICRFKKNISIDIIIISILISSFLLGIFCLYTLMALKPAWAIDTENLRISGTFLIFNHLSAYEVLIFFFLLGLYLNSNNIYFKVFLILAIGLSIIAQLASLTLGGILGIIGGILFLILINENKLRNFAILILLSIIISIGVYFLYPPIISKFSIISERIIDRIIANYTGLVMIKRYFWFGAGSELGEIIQSHPNLLYTPFGSGWCVPHNLFITTFATTGIFSFLSLLYLLIAIIIRLKDIYPKIKVSKNRNFYISLLAGIIAFFLQSMSNNIFWHIILGSYMFLFIGFWLKFDEEGDFAFPFFKYTGVK